MKLAEKLKNENIELTKNLETLENNLRHDATRDTEKEKLSKYQETLEYLKNKLIVAEQSLEGKDAQMKIESTSHNQDKKNLQLQLTKLEEKLRDESEKRKIEKQSYNEDTAKYRETVETLTRKLGRINLMNESLKRTIQKIDTGKEISVNENVRESTTKKNIERKRKALILGGRSDYNYGKIFKSLTEATFDTNCQNTNDDSLEEITKHHEKLGKNLNSDDVEIIFCHAQNARQTKNTTMETLTRIIQASKHTRVIIVGAVFVPGKIVLNQFITKQNTDIEHYIKDYDNIIYIDSNKVLKSYQIDSNGDVNAKGKWSLMDFIVKHHINSISKSTQTISNHKTLPMKNVGFPESDSDTNDAKMQDATTGANTSTTTNVRHRTIAQ